MNIIICNSLSFKYFEDYIYSVLPVINGQLILFDYEINIDIDINNNYIFIQNIDNKFFEYIKNNNIYLINTEQLSVETLQIGINKYPNELIIIDYSIANLKYYDKKFTKFLLPYHINYNEILNIYKSNNICLIGEPTNIPFNRKNIVNLLKEKNINVDIISGFGKARDLQIFKYKIILNIGYTPSYTVMESIRCDRCVYNKMIVISDMKDDTENYYLKQHVIFTEYNNIPDKVIEVINNYEEHYNKLFSSFEFKEIEENLDNLSKPLIDKLNLHNNNKNLV